jgi:hypothetical protein
MRLSPEIELKLVKESERGAKARAVFESDVFKEAIDLIEQDTMEKWKTSPVRDAEGQLMLRLKWQILKQLKTQIMDVMQTGKMADVTLIEQRSLKERVVNAVGNALRR